jgi:hypothetical protein
MTHLEVENLASDYLEGLLDPELKGGVEAHLGACPSCLDMVEGARRALELCHAAPELDPAPWLVGKIMLATVGERQPTLVERLAAFIRRGLQPRFAYSVAMAVFSFSIIVNAAGINLRHMTVEDLNPLTWFFRANRAGHLYYARAEKFYYDLRVVYEIESRLRQFRSAPEEEQGAPKQDPPAGGSSNMAPVTLPALAANQAWFVGGADRAASWRNEIKASPISWDEVRSQEP